MFVEKQIIKKCGRLHFVEPFSGGVDLFGFGVDPVF